MKFTRRQYIKLGLVGAAATLLARLAYGPFQSDPISPMDSGHGYRVLSLTERTMISAIAEVMLGDALPREVAEHRDALLQTVRGVDQAIVGLPFAVQAEIAQLFALLAFPLTRRTLAGVRRPWLEASPESIAAFLERWRRSRLAVLRSGYQALHELTMAAWYGNPASWPAIGYPGPPSVG